MLGLDPKQTFWILVFILIAVTSVIGHLISAIRDVKLAAEETYRRRIGLMMSESNDRDPNPPGFSELIK